MNRNQLISIKKWLNKSHRKPLVVRGARQVGKSTLIDLFAQQQHIPLTQINLERFNNLSPAFQSNDPRAILDVLEALPGVNTVSAASLLFLDEIQAVPEAIAALRYFYEDMPQLAVVCAGSLLEYALRDQRFSMPVGRVEYLHMGPMTFSEFLEALDETRLLATICEFTLDSEINPVVHGRLMELLRYYYFVGGMPEAVSVFATTRSLKEVGDVHNSIIQTYREDFPKYIGSRSLSRVQQVFNFAARNVGKKVKYSQYSNVDTSATIKSDIELLCLARVLSKVIHSHCSGLPLQADLEEKMYKLIFLDVGLMNAICGVNWNSISRMTESTLVNEGTIAEQFIGQHLLELLAESPNRELNYWLREGRSNNAELDYVIALNGRIVPIEVKAGATGSLKSLHQFMGEKLASEASPLAVRFDMNLPSRQTIQTRIKKGEQVHDLQYELLSLPLYLVERLPALV
ncbi:MAG: AAA family ATPase [Gammaproteobacteria bacterium]|nr:AAA family ATPase [Gammaproteobacteria bacterium]